jgi:hypothetical protein
LDYLLYARPIKSPLVSSFFDKAQMLDLLGGCRPPNFSRNFYWHDIKEMPGSVASGTHCIKIMYIQSPPCFIFRYKPRVLLSLIFSIPDCPYITLTQF